MMQRHMPIGYKLVDGKIQFDEAKAAVVKRIFSDYLSGSSTFTLAKQLAEIGFPNANNKASWNHGSIGKILENVKYLGDEFYPGMIDAEVFEQVQKRRQERCEQLGRSIQPNSAKHQHPFTGRLRCGQRVKIRGFKQCEATFDRLMGNHWLKADKGFKANMDFCDIDKLTCDLIIDEENKKGTKQLLLDPYV